MKEPQLSVISTETLEKIELLPVPPPNAVVIDALEAIKTTPFASSFAARLLGHAVDETAGYIARDWNTRSPWMNLMDDIHEHHTLAQ